MIHSQTEVLELIETPSPGILAVFSLLFQEISSWQELLMSSCTGGFFSVLLSFSGLEKAGGETTSLLGKKQQQKDYDLSFFERPKTIALESTIDVLMRAEVLA